MGLRCIIGHDYGGPEQTKTREERGDERVVTVREYRECTRCGHQQVISENTEVRSTEEPGPEEATEAERSDPADATPTSGPGRSKEDVGDSERAYEEESTETDDGVILEDEPERDSGEWHESDHEAREEADPEAEAQADHGDWPDEHREKVAEEARTNQGDWPTPEGEDEGFDAKPSSGGPDESVDFGGGLHPDRSGEPVEEGAETIEGPGGSAEDAAFTDASATSDAPTGIRRSEPGPTPTTQQRPANPDTKFVCPNCEYTATAHESSLRPGDICPNCSRGYLTEREDE